jgi:hypothetical protein
VIQEGMLQPFFEQHEALASADIAGAGRRSRAAANVEHDHPAHDQQARHRAAAG